MRSLGLRNPVCVIPNGIDLPEDPPGAPFSAWPDDGRPVLVFLGRVHPKKGIRELLRAWTLLRSERAVGDWRLAIYGWDQNGHGEEINRFIAHEGLENDVGWFGPVYGELKDAVMRRAQALILPSFSEGLPLTVLEAWAYGLPVVMTPQCNLLEGFTAEAAVRISTEPESIVAGLRRLFEMNTAERRDMGTRGRRLVTNQFNWPSVGLNMKAVYQWLLGGGSAPGCVLTN